MAGVAVFACGFSLLYRPADYLLLLVTLIGAIYLGGVGAVVWGGLYWKKGTTAGAWAAMIIGTSLAAAFNIVQPFWTSIQPLLVHLAGSSRFGAYLALHPDRCPINGQWFSTSTAVLALVAYVVVSLLTCKEDFNMDQMLHRGRYALPSDGGERPRRANFSWGALIGIDENYTRADKALSITTFVYQMAWKPVTLSVILWWAFVGHQSDEWWFKYSIVCNVWIAIPIAALSTIWLTVGTIYDLIDLFKTLRSVQRSDADDGTVKDHRLADEAEAADRRSPQKVAAARN